jgi:poly(hydroxyalkanoate) granule-associated protein
MGAIAKAQKEGPAAFQDAVADGLKLLTRSRSQTEKMIRDVFESAQDTVQSRIGSARDQATETWDNLEALFQHRVQKALQQLGVPSGDEIRLLTKRVAELNENVKALSARPARGRRARGKAPRARAKRKTRAA